MSWVCFYAIKLKDELEQWNKSHKYTIDLDALLAAALTSSPTETSKLSTELIRAGLLKRWNIKMQIIPSVVWTLLKTLDEICCFMLITRTCVDSRYLYYYSFLFIGRINQERHVLYDIRLFYIIAKSMLFITLNKKILVLKYL